MDPKISLIAAISDNRALGKDNDLIYKIPDDLKRFRELTSGHPVIMGRKTYESIGRVLPNRLNIIVSRDADYKVDGAVVVRSVEEAVEEAKRENQESGIRNQGEKNHNSSFLIHNSGEVFIIGGGQIFEQAIKFADTLYLTIIHEIVKDADVFFPDYSGFKEVSSEEHAWNGIKYSFKKFQK